MVSQVPSRSGLAWLVVLVLTAAVTVGVAADRRGSVQAARHLTVMTQNLYLGSSLTSSITATSPREYVDAVARIYGTAVRTDFPARAAAIADTILAERPDLVGLQEVTSWTTRPTHDGPTPVSFDFLAILSAELAARRLDYRVGAVSSNADIGPAPLAAPAYGCRPPASAGWVPDCEVSLLDRDVILVSAQTADLEVTRASSGEYGAQETLTPPIGAPISFARGWAAVDGVFEGTAFRFVTTHLELDRYPDTQEAQAKEFLAGPALDPGVVIATGDFNSSADPGSDEPTTTTYADLTGAWFEDAWSVNRGDPGLTCCRDEMLSYATSELHTRVDLVLMHGPARPEAAHLVGDSPIPGVAGVPRWASDHAGVVATLRLE